MRFYFILVALFSTLNTSALPSGFETELSAFGFSLPPILKPYESKQLWQNKYDRNDLITSKMDSFVRVNKEEIFAYQLQLLSKYEDEVNLQNSVSQYTAADASTFNNSLKEKNINELFPLSKLWWINPLEEVVMYRNMCWMSKQNHAAYVDFDARHTIGSSLIDTKKIDEHQWQIVENVYDHIFIATYSLNAKRVSHLKIFTRNSEAHQE